MSIDSLPIGITMGDPVGIGPEIIAKLFSEGLDVPAVVYGDANSLNRAIQMLGLDMVVQLVDRQAWLLERHCSSVDSGTPPRSNDRGFNSFPESVLTRSSRTIPLIQSGPALPDLPWGQVDARAGRCAYEAVCLAIDDAMDGRLRAIVTAPLNKQAMHAAGIDFPGHTEILAERSGTEHVAMMLANKELKVLLATIHVALSDVPSLITQEQELRSIRLAHQACVQAGIPHPSVAVAGLNPHAGEDGKFGREDIDIIQPAIELAIAEGIHASGPWPGDTIFMRARRGEFDIVVAQYHDQGLIPIKFMGVDEGVNVTVGLPFVRTSVDHGTAFDIAGQGKADASSLRCAFELAKHMTKGHQPDAKPL